MHGNAATIRRAAYLALVREIRSQRRYDDGMRHIALVMLFACGSSTAQPSGPELMEDDGYEPPQRTPRLSDASVAVAAVDAAADAAPPDAAQVTAIDAGNITYENGVPMMRAVRPVWCSPQKPKLCAGTAADCRKTFKTKCVRRDAYACFIAKAHTSGHDVIGCFYDYGACTDGAYDAGLNPEITSMSDCAIMRYDAGSE